MSEAPVIDIADVKYLYHWGYYDGPLSGVCLWRGKRYWFLCVDMDDSHRRTFHLLDLTEQEWEEEDARHALWVQCVGTHCEYDETRCPDLGRTRPQSEWQRYYDAYPPDKGSRELAWREREPVAIYHE